MNIDREKQLKVIVKTNDLLQTTEKERMLLRFQRGVIDLENNRFGILNNSEFIEKLINHLYTLHQTGSDGKSFGILEKIGFCACDETDRELRERAVCVLSMFISKISREQNSPEFLEAIAHILVNWLQIETEYLAGFPSICFQLQTILQKMLERGLWQQTETLIFILSQIKKGRIRKDKLIRKTIGKIHSSLAEETLLKNLVDAYLDKKEGRRDTAQCLLLHFGSRAAAILVQTLINCPDKEKRFPLIEFIPLTGKVVLPVCEFYLKQNPPWYVIRNLIIIISQMDDPNLYDMVQPYLVHKDIRVQLQVLTCITKFGGGQMRDRLIEALNCINDELKQQVVVQLGNMGGKDVGNALCDLLEKRDEFAQHVQDELVLTICTQIKFEPSIRAIKLIKEFISERTQRFGEGDAILQAAQDALVCMELKNSSNSTDNLSFAQSVAPSDSEVTKVPVVTEEELDSLLQDILPDTEEELEPPPELPKVTKKEESPKSSEPLQPGSKKDIIQEAGKYLTDPSSAIHSILWSNLYDEMTTEEFTTFHSALKLRTYQQDEMIVAQGESEAPLFLFDSGIVKLIRIQEGEELHLCPIGAGDLIGSDILLTGHAWNVSLYAAEIVHARVFNLEDLQKMQVSFPRLADKILNFTLKYDVLPALIRVLDTPETKITESIRIERGRKSKKPTDGILRQATILKKLHGGLCFSSPVEETEKIDSLLEKQFRLIVRYPSGIIEPLFSTIIGTMRILTRPREVIVFLRFSEPLADLNYSCESFEFLEPV
ncbi:MAG: cyclic nucleotide-binding domain-containing protein [Pseudomonadota bacterium]